MPAVTHRHLTIQVMQARLRLLMREPETSEILELRALHLEYLHRLLLMRYTSRPRKYQRRVRSLNNANGFSNSAPLSVEEIRLNSAEFGDLLERVTPLWPTTPGRGCSSALNYFIRGAAAVAKLAPSVIEWPTEERRLAIKSAIAADYDIPNCVGFLDGVHVVLDRAPALEKQLQAKFYNRKGCYSLMMIASCDETKRFTYLQAGYNGAASDMRAQRECTLTTSPELLFSKGEYLLCDAGFKCTEYVLPLYKKPRNRPYEPHMLYFNRKGAQPRVKIEHAFGMLKLRWQALKGLGARLSHRKFDHLITWEVVKAAMVLHNLYIDTAPPYEPSEAELRAEVAEREEQEALADATEATEPHGVDNVDYQRREYVAWLTAVADKRLDAQRMRELFPVRPVNVEDMQ